MYDSIIIGGGPAAMAASLYAARQKINFLVISKDIGGQIAWSSDVENYPGCSAMSGAELVSAFQKQLASNGVKVKSEDVKNIRKKGKNFVVEADHNYEAKTVLIATGKKPRKLGIPGEDKFQKKGIAYCAVCDAPVFSGMDVAVIGGGNSAMDAALTLEKYAKKVYILTVNDNLFGEQSLINSIKKSSKIEIFYNSNVKEFKGDEMLSSLIFEQNGAKELGVRGAFIEIGSIPSNSFDKLTKKNKWNEIIIHEENGISNMTSVKGIFAAGDVTNVPEKQVIVAAGEAVKAILGIFKYLNAEK